MLAFSLRRRSAPGSVNVRDSSASPNRLPGNSIPSVSSKKSLSSLFSLATKDSSPRSTKPSDEPGVVEQHQHPVYDAAKPDHTPEKDTSIRLKRSKRYSPSRRRSSSGSRTFLDNLASKMRAATEFFHKTSDTNCQDDNDSGPLPPARSISPKKSVRFRSGTYPSSETKSSPIAVPRKSAPTLPQLELPKAPFMNNFSPVASDPIPTGRPLDTPVLKADETDSYFAGAIKPDTFHGYQDCMHPPLPLRTKLSSHRDPPVGDPVSDSADISKVLVRSGSPHVSESSTAATADAESSIRNKLAGLKSSTESSNQTSDTLYEEDQPQVKQIEDALDSLEAPVSVNAGLKADEPQRPRIGADYQPPSAQVSFAIVQPEPSSFNGENRDKVAAFRQSAWTLASREPEKAAGDGNTSASDDGDAQHSRPVSPRRSQRHQPTHEDIRRQFRLSRAKAPVNSGENLSSPIAPAVECEASSERVPKDSLSQAGSAAEEVMKTDPSKPLPQTTPRAPASEQEVIIPEHAVSPLNLKANVFSTSPSRTRRPFRFTNSTDKDPHASPIGNTSFSWHAKKEEETPANSAVHETQTPSPVCVPLPLSIPPKKFAPTMMKALPRYGDQYGWSPFDEEMFLDVFLSASHLRHLLLQQGGFYTFWKEAGLPVDSAPTFDTDELSQEQMSDLLQTARHLRRAGLPAQNLVAPNAMDQMFSPWQGSSVNRFGPLMRHQDYSGEVSTIDMSTAEVCSDAGAHCAERNSNMCLTSENYESSDGPSMPSSVCGYDSDEEETASDGENARLVETLTPSRVPKPIASDKTPRQTDYAKHQMGPRGQRASKFFRTSRTSDTTISSVGMSEDESFAKGIV